MNPAFHPALQASCERLLSESEMISEERRERLKALSDYIRGKLEDGQPVRLVVICTHNSRRSQMGQLWLWAAARWFGLERVESFSGGTEATAFHPNAVAALQRAGFGIEARGKGTNPTYAVTLGPDLPVLQCFSKTYDHPANPRQGFAAIMVCSEADAGCPFVPGAETRFSLPYEDPKAYDGHPDEQAAYDERVRQIGREMLWAVQQAAGRGFSVDR
ncbi:MAG: protein-tyrosine-phosphatase [Bacteroidetes bacterium]|nr:MAG: protein-tyrosine-phosphatase [Bacteroidota bacterium]